MKHLVLLSALCGFVTFSAAMQASAQTTEPRIVTNSAGITLQLLPGGSFKMGSNQDVDSLLAKFRAVTDQVNAEDFEGQFPYHQVHVAGPFFIGSTEVTQKQWFNVMGTTPWMDPSFPRSPRYAVEQRESHPAQYISWYDAVEFCNRLSAQEGLEKAYVISRIYREDEDSSITRADVKLSEFGNGYRLPSEAEWEYACRAGTTTLFSFGDDPKSLPDYGWTHRNAERLEGQDVATKKPNPFGLFDMHGGLGEWCFDWYSDDFYSTSRVSSPEGPGSGKRRVIRGGSYEYGDQMAHSSARDHGEPHERYPAIGFRVVTKVAKGVIPPEAQGNHQPLSDAELQIILRAQRIAIDNAAENTLRLIEAAGN